jgi:hypothetical protein
MDGKTHPFEGPCVSGMERTGDFRPEIFEDQVAFSMAHHVFSP